jgi:predicted transposase/invertase (TIGR01784 family)
MKETKPPKYMNPYTDFGFKRLFGMEANKDLLTDFLNEFLPHFKYDEGEEKKKFERYVQLKDQDGDIFYNKLHFKFLQMPLFTKTELELTTHYDKWCYFLKNLESFDHIPDILNEPIFEKAFHISEIGAMNITEYDIYQESLLNYWETKGIVDTAKAEGKVEGNVEGRVEVVLNGIKLGLSNEIIQQLTGLSLNEIQKQRGKN